MLSNADFKISYLDLALVNHVEIITFVTCLSTTNKDITEHTPQHIMKRNCILIIMS